MNAYVRQHCSVHGVHYPHQKIDDIKYHTGTRVCHVSNIFEHFPKVDHIFGRWVRIVYDDQPDCKKTTNTGDEEVQENEMTTQQKQPMHIIEETPVVEMPPSPIVADQPKQTKSADIIAETPLNDMPKAEDENTNIPKLNTEIEPTIPTPHLIMDSP